MIDTGGATLGSELGQGALGRVVVVNLPDGQSLAGKILHASHQDDPRAAERFAREADLLGDVSHPNLVRVHGLATIEGERVLLMERIDGPTLAEVIAGGPLPSPRLLRVGSGIAAGLLAAHRAGLVHRDLKPANVLLAEGDVAKIVDFGLARAASFAGIDRRSFTLVGTPDYLAPEAIDPLAVDTRSDLYALGCMLHEMATGRPPYGGATPFAVIEAHRSAPIPTLPGRLGDLVRALLAKSPADRPQSAELVLSELAAIPGDALVVRAAARPPVRCSRCGEPLVAGVPICFGCAEPILGLADGAFTVFVIGPGEHTHKLDSGIRQRLHDWLVANPGLGLDPAPLAKEVPRLPFAMAVGLDEKSALGLVAALQTLGLVAVSHPGGRLGLPLMRAKALRMGGRWAIATVGGMLGMSGQLFHFPLVALPLLLGIPAASVARGFWTASRPMALRRPTEKGGLPAVLAERVAKLTTVVPGIHERRHRESLRAVVQRALALHVSAPQFADDLAQLLDLALVAAGRMDLLEQRLLLADLREPDERTTADLHERDAWAARLLDVTGRLDALRARFAATSASPLVTDELLADLRAQVEALEEVQKP